MQYSFYRAGILFFFLTAPFSNALCMPSAPAPAASLVSAKSVERRLYAVIVRSHKEDDLASSKQITSLMSGLRSPSILHSVVVWAAVQRNGCHADGICPACDRYDEITNEGFGALAKLKSDAAARELISLLADKRVPIDGDYGGEIAAAITYLGKPTIPYLTMLPKNGFAQYLLKYVRRGQVLIYP